MSSPWVVNVHLYISIISLQSIIAPIIIRSRLTQYSRGNFVRNSNFYLSVNLSIEPILAEDLIYIFYLQLPH